MAHGEDGEAITWIHLSDFHAGQAGDAVWGQVDAELQPSVRRMVDLLGVPDVVLFTGDLANHGQAAEYVLVNRLLDRLNTWCGRDVPVFAVPGNHDVVRPGANAWQFAGFPSYDERPEIARAMWKEHQPVLEPLFPHYTKWAQERMGESLRRAGWELHVSKRVPGDSSVVLTKGTMRLGLVGLNTAWAHLTDIEGGLPLPVEQLPAALPERSGGHPQDWFQDVDDALLLTHHPWSWFGEKGLATYREAVYTKGRFALALYGHVHQGRSEVVSVSGTTPRAFYQGQSIFGLEHHGTKSERRSIGYAWGRLTAGGEIRVWPLIRTPRHDGTWAFARDPGFEPVEDALGGVLLRWGRELGMPGQSGRPRKPVRRPSPAFLEALERYRDKAQSLHGTLSLTGFHTRVRVPIQIDDLYVPLHAVAELEGVRSSGFADANEAEQRAKGRGTKRVEVELAQAFTHAQQHGRRRGVVILGDPGSGKTTQLRRMLLATLRPESRVLGLPPGVVPVFLPLRAFESSKQTLEAFVAAQLAELELSGSDRFAAELVHEHRKVLYLLDGLDEVADDGLRADVSRWIERQLAAHPDAWFAVTCRYAGYHGKAQLTEGLLELHLRPLTEELSKEFVERWFSIVEKTLDLDEEVGRRKAVEGASKLLEAMREPGFRNQRISMLTRNPLLLTTICLVHRDRGRLPHRRVELYDECVTILLELWRESKKLRVTLPAAAAQRVLQPVARWLHEVEERRQATDVELIPVVEKALTAEGATETSGRADAFLRSVRDESGLLTGWSGNLYGFMHLGFQEYLAATELRRRGFDDPMVLWSLAGHFLDAWWQEVILLMLGLENPPTFERFMAALLRRSDLSDWVDSEMMAMCMEEARGRSPRPFVELVREGTDGDAVKVGQQQVTALRVLARWFPEELEQLEELLQSHPSTLVRGWWGARTGRRERERQRELGLEAVTASRGGMQLVLVPGGRFTMGSPESDEEADNDEKPQHEVELASFYLARTPVTNAQYRAYLQENPGVEEPLFWGDRRFNQDDQPVTGVSWHDAQAYCAWAGLVLPTEAQWEHACRAGTTTRYWSGAREEDLARVGWYLDNSGDRLHPVGELEASPWGLYDMHGNVWEWCLDGYGAAYDVFARPGDGLRREPDGITHRVTRGGSYGGRARIARSACREGFRHSEREGVVGFRPAKPCR